MNCAPACRPPYGIARSRQPIAVSAQAVALLCRASKQLLAHGQLLPQHRKLVGHLRVEEIEQVGRRTIARGACVIALNQRRQHVHHAPAILVLH